MSVTFGELGHQFGADEITFGGDRTFQSGGRRFMPLWSIKSWRRFYGRFPFGSFYNYGLYGYDYAIYQRRRTWHGIVCIKEKYYKPYNPRTSSQQANRQKIADGVSVWQSLSEADKEVYNGYSYPTQMSGYNKFLHYYLREAVIVENYLLSEDGSYLLLEDNGKIILEE